LRDHLVDLPIECPDDDELGFDQVSQALVEAISAQPNLSSMTLGLDGPWGSGKSSILKLMRRNLDDFPSDGIGLVVVPFSPWLITNRAALVSAFFAQISEAISQAERRIPRTWRIFRKEISNKLSMVQKKINRFSRVVSIASTGASVIDPLIAGAVAAGSKGVERLTEDKGVGKTLEAQKMELEQALRDIAKIDPTFRILVLIDDLDRLDPDDVLEILRLVKAVGDFPATTYLLSYDRSAVGRAIENSAKVKDGDAYLEKIVQFSFKVPPLEPFKLRNWLSAEIQKLFPGDAEFGAFRTNVVIDVWAGRLLQTPRDVKRLLFAIRALWPKLRGKADLVDLIWLQLVAQKASDGEKNLYSWLVGYLQGLEAIAIGGNVSSKEKDENDLKKILNSIGWQIKMNGSSISQIDFHNIDEIIAGIQSSYLSEDEVDWIYQNKPGYLDDFRSSRRLSSPWHWRLYFALNPPSHAVTDDEWGALEDAAARSVSDLAESLTTVMDFRSGQRRDASDQVLERLLRLQHGNALENASRWLVVLVDRVNLMEDRSKAAGLGFTKQFRINLRIFARNTINDLEGESRSSTLDAVFNRRSALDASSDLLREQMHVASKGESEPERSAKLYLNDSELNFAKSAQLGLYQALTPSDLRSLRDPYEVLWAWREIEDSVDEPKALLEQAFISDEGFLATLDALRAYTSSSQNGVPHIPESYLEPFVDVKETKQRLSALAAKGNSAEDAAKMVHLWWSKER